MKTVYPSERELVRNLNEGCRHSFEKIYDLYWEQLYLSAYARIKDQETVEDMVQEIFIDLWNRRQSLRIQGSLKAYLLTAVKYQVLKKLDANRIKRELEVENWEIPYHQNDMLEFEDLFRELKVAIDKLPEKSQLIFTMSRFEGLSTEEIAHKLELSPQTVHNRMSQSLSVLRNELKEYAPIITLIFLNQTN